MAVVTLTLMREVNESSSVGITIESYGVKIRLESNEGQVLSALVDAASEALLGDLKVIENLEDTEHKLGVFRNDAGGFDFFQDGGVVSSSSPTDVVPIELFTRLLRLKISEFAVDKVFVHAGVVGWKGKAIVIPADSNKGKTTLVIELVKLGAEYYSDEYAVLDPNGLVCPFTRDLSVRAEGRVWSEKDGIPVENFGGKRGTEPIPIGALILTEYVAGSTWLPEKLTVGSGILETILHTIPLRVNAEFSLNVLKNALSRAIILKSPRPDAGETAEKLLSFIDKQADLETKSHIG